MVLRQRFLTYLKTLNPEMYQELCSELSFLQAFIQFLFNFGMLFLVMLLLFIPAVIIGAPKLQEAVSEFDTFVLDGNFSAPRPIQLFETPRVAVDLSENATMDREQLLITKEGLVWKRWYLFGETVKSWSEIQDGKNVAEGFYLFVLVFLLPAFAFWVGVFLLGKYLLIAFFFSLLAFFIPRLFRFFISFSDALKVSLFAATLMATVEMLLFPFYRMFWLPFCLYLLLLSIGVALVADRHLDGAPRKTKPRHHDLWKERKQ